MVSLNQAPWEDGEVIITGGSRPAGPCAGGGTMGAAAHTSQPHTLIRVKMSIFVCLIVGGIIHVLLNCYVTN